MRFVIFVALAAGTSGCAVQQPEPLHYSVATMEAARLAAATPAGPDDRALPNPRPPLSYDIEAISKLEPWKDKETAICERVARWTAYVAELPETERARYRRLRANLEGYDFKVQHDRDPYVSLQATADALRQRATSQGAQIVAMPGYSSDEEGARRWSGFSIEDMERATTLYRCGGTEPPARLATELSSRRAAQAEAARCAADPACVAQHRRERITALREVMCQDVGQRQGAQANIREEWKYAHQAGVVDLQNLSDNRTLLEMADEHLQEGQAEWKHLTGKAFTPKRDCGTAAR